MCFLIVCELKGMFKKNDEPKQFLPIKYYQSMLEKKKKIIIEIAMIFSSL